MAQAAKASPNAATRVRWVEPRFELKNPYFLGGVALFLGVTIVLYLSGALNESAAVAVLYAGCVLLVVGFAGLSIWPAAKGLAPRLVILALLLCTAALSLVSGLTTVLPGAPLSQGRLQNPGDQIPLPPNAAGPARLLIHGDLGQRQYADVTIRMEAGEREFEGHLSRRVSRTRSRRFSQGTSVYEQSTEYLSARIPAGAVHLVLNELDGPLSGGVEVRVYREWLPFLWQLVLGAALLIGTAISAAWLRAANLTPGLVGFLLALSSLYYRSATPDHALADGLGVLVLALPIGLVLGGGLTWLSRKLLLRSA